MYACIKNTHLYYSLAAFNESNVYEPFSKDVDPMVGFKRNRKLAPKLTFDLTHLKSYFDSGLVKGSHQSKALTGVNRSE